MTLDLSYVKSATVLPGQIEQIRFILVGCGGTGGWLAPSIARLARLLIDQQCDVKVLFCDPDTVEERNLTRQNFCYAELGQNKAATLAARYGAAWGLEIFAITKPLHRTEVGYRPGLNIIIGCVDNAAARNAISRTVLDHGGNERYWWLDCGNTESGGQVLFGSTDDANVLKNAFLSPTACKALPLPSVQAPDLLVPRPEEVSNNRMSCAELAQANAQSLSVNQQVAAVAFDYLLRFVNGRLRRMATYFDLESGSMRSVYVTPETVNPKRKARKEQ